MTETERGTSPSLGVVNACLLVSAGGRGRDSTLQTVGALPPRVWACRRHSQCQCGCLKRTESDSGEQCGPPAHTASEGAGLRPALKVAVLDGAGRSAAHTFYFNTLYLNTSIPQYTGTGGVKVAASSRNGGKRQRRLTLRLTLRRRTDRQQRPLRLQLRRRRQEPGRGQRREERRQGRPDAWRRRRRAWRSKGKRSRYSVATPSYDFFLSASLNHEKCLPGAATTTARSTP